MKEKIGKKGIKRRLFSIALALAMVFSLIPLNSKIVYAVDPRTFNRYTIEYNGNVWEAGFSEELKEGDTLTECTLNKAAGEVFVDKKKVSMGATLNGTVSKIDGLKLYLCTNHSEDPGTLCDNCEPESSHESSEPSDDEEDEDDDHESSGSNDDDSSPAPPTPHQSAQNAIYSSVDTQLAAIATSSNGQVIVDGKDLVNALPNATMKKIAENPNAIVYFTYTYNDAKYTSAITGSNVDTSVEWYGPMYFITHYPTMWHQDANTSVPVVAPVK